MSLFSMNHVDASWIPVISDALGKMDSDYLAHLYQSNHWLPGHQAIFNAFSQPVERINYVLFGESPYPRKQSANGYAFWDAAITDLWSSSGLSKPVNRATSMRNIIKMLLVAEGLLPSDKTSQDDIAVLDKSSLVQQGNDFFQNLLNHGFLLLNTTLVLQNESPQTDARAWRPFMRSILAWLLGQRPDVNLILFGRIAKEIHELTDIPGNNCLSCEHPYNISFINNPSVQSFFKPLHLLRAV